MVGGGVFSILFSAQIQDQNTLMNLTPNLRIVLNAGKNKIGLNFGLKVLDE